MSAINGAFIKRALTSKLAWALAVIHALLVIVGLYQRGGFDSPLHFTYEPLILKPLFFVDYLWFALADMLNLGSIGQPRIAYLFMLIGGSLQWFVIGNLGGRERDTDDHAQQIPTM